MNSNKKLKMKTTATVMNGVLMLLIGLFGIIFIHEPIFVYIAFKVISMIGIILIVVGSLVKTKT